MAKRVILIRHGQTDWNLKGIYQGYADTDLNATGKAQAKRLSARMRGEDVSAVYSSDRRRALDFAKIVFKTITINDEPDLKEISFGIFEGLGYEEIMKRQPELYSRWISDPFGVTIPEAEAPSAFKERVSRVFDRILQANPGGTIAIVTHGGVINVIVTGILKLEKRQDFIPALASLNIIEFRRSRPAAILLNDTEHLKNG